MSPEARNTAKQLLVMFEANEINKGTRLHEASSIGQEYIQYKRPDGQDVQFLLPMDDVKELEQYGILTLETRINNKGRLSGWDMLILPERLREVVHGKSQLDTYRIFYSWQSWTPRKVNHSFIEEAIDKATKAIRNDKTIEVNPVIDRDTRGESGSADIAATIFRKIKESQIFICDATIVGRTESGKSSPNPNVMIELGYAAAVLGWERVICIVNTAYGTVEQMPFDLRSRRLLTYEFKEGDPEKTEIKQNLSVAIRREIEGIIAKDS